MVARSPDFARTASDYACHRAGFPAELLDRLAANGIARAGACVVDFGTGTGSLARLFAPHGFTGIETFSFDVQVPYSHEAWVGRISASGPIAGTLEEAGVEACSRDLTAMLAERFPEDPLGIPHRVWAVTARVPAS